MKINQLKSGSILSYLQMFINIAISIIYTPFMLSILGKSEYGLYSTVSSTIAMLAVLNLGFNSSYVRYFMKYKVENDKKSIAKLNGLFIIIFSVIGIVALICGLFLSFNLNLVFSTGLTAQEYATAKKLMILLSFNMAISFPMSVFSNIIVAHERYFFLKLLGLIKNVASPLMTIPLLLSGFRSVSIVATTITLALVTDIIYLIYAKKYLKIEFSFCRIPKDLFKSLFAFSAFIAINLIIDQINNNVDKVLLGRYCGTEQVAVYAVGFSLYHYYMLFSTSISNVFTPRVHKIINETKGNINQQREKTTELFIKVGRIQYILLALLASGIVFFGKPFIKLWVGNEYHDAYIVAVLLIISSTIALIQNIGIEVQRALNKHQFRSISYFIMALMNIALTIVLCQEYGAIGATIGTATSLIIANGLIMNIYYQKKCNLNIILFWKNILRLSLGMVIPIIVGIIINYLIDFSSYITLITGVLIYTVIYCASMWFIGINKYEKQLVLSPIKKLARR